jgi:hypothetical protein
VRRGRGGKLTCSFTSPTNFWSKILRNLRKEVSDGTGRARRS